MVLAIVGTAAYLEWQKARESEAAQAIGDAVLAAMESDDAADRLVALEAIEASEAVAVVAMLTAREAELAGDMDSAVRALESVALNASLPLEYTQLAALKSLMVQHATLSAEDRRFGFEGLASPGNPYRMLAAEQLALIEVEIGQIDTAIERLEAIRADAETSEGLRARATQLIVALGGTPADANEVPSASGN